MFTKTPVKPRVNTSAKTPGAPKDCVSVKIFARYKGDVKNPCFALIKEACETKGIDLLTNVNQAVVYSSVFEGNVSCDTTVCAYGLSGTGKTHTMIGNIKEKGLIAQYLCNFFQKNSGVNVEMKTTEIYLNKVLFTKTETLNAENYQSGLDALANRSQLIVTVTINNVNLTFVDLAGSESIKEGVPADETKAINLSLFQLGKVLRELKDNSQRISWRENKLTEELASIGNTAIKILLLVNNQDGAMKTINFGAELLALKCNVETEKCNNSICALSSENPAVPQVGITTTQSENPPVPQVGITTTPYENPPVPQVSISNVPPDLDKFLEDCRLQEYGHKFVEHGAKSVEVLRHFYGMTYDQFKDNETIKLINFKAFGLMAFFDQIQRYFGPKNDNQMSRNDNQMNHSELSIDLNPKVQKAITKDSKSHKKSIKKAITKTRSESTTDFNDENAPPQVNRDKKKIALPPQNGNKKHKSVSNFNVFERPTDLEIDHLAHNDWEGLVEEGWKLDTTNLIKNQINVPVILPSYTSDVHVKEIRDNSSSSTFIENRHYFRIKQVVEGEHPLKQYLKRYGIHLRPLNESQLGDLLVKHKNWQWIGSKSHWGISPTNTWFRAGVVIPNKPQKLDHLSLGTDYFFTAEEIADYLNALSGEDRLPVVEVW